MWLPSTCLHFGTTQNQTLTVETSHKDQADRAKDLKLCIMQQEETLQGLYGEEVELSPSPLLLEEMEECFSDSDWAAMDYVPDRNCISPAHSSSRRSSFRLDFPPVLDGIIVGGQSPPCSYPAPSAVPRSSVRPPTPACVLAGLKLAHRECMREHCLECVPHLMAYPQDLPHVHSILQTEFLEEGWLDAPAPLSAGGPFTPLPEAVVAAGSTGPQPAAAGSTGPQPAAARSSEPQPAVAGSTGSSELMPAAAESTGSSEPQPAAAGSTGSSESREGFKVEPPLILVPEFPEGFNGEPPLILVPEFPEGSGDELSLLPAPEGFGDEPPLLPAPEGFGDEPPLLPAPEGVGDEPPLLPAPEGVGDEPPLLPAPEGVGDEPPLLPAPEVVGDEPPLISPGQTHTMTVHSLTPGQTHTMTLHSLTPGQTHTMTLHSLTPGQTHTMTLHSLTPVPQGSCLGPSVCRGSGLAASLLDDSIYVTASLRGACISVTASLRGARFLVAELSTCFYVADLRDACISAADLLDVCTSASGHSAAGLLIGCCSADGYSAAGLLIGCCFATGLRIFSLFTGFFVTGLRIVGYFAAGLPTVSCFAAGFFIAGLLDFIFIFCFGLWILVFPLMDKFGSSYLVHPSFTLHSLPHVYVLCLQSLPM
ncbi:hypothetical protein CRENBAI_009144 [Crenichthys baileyi]|uniref:Uncharacterized protein n=1 Tax=Crenichthys baileyi TaxID=28760 RepID=A0AAV9S7U6_9TELE